MPAYSLEELLEAFFLLAVNITVSSRCKVRYHSCTSAIFEKIVLFFNVLSVKYSPPLDLRGLLKKKPLNRHRRLLLLQHCAGGIVAWSCGVKVPPRHTLDQSPWRRYLTQSAASHQGVYTQCVMMCLCQSCKHNGLKTSVDGWTQWKGECKQVKEKGSRWDLDLLSSLCEVNTAPVVNVSLPCYIRRQQWKYSPSLPLDTSEKVCERFGRIGRSVGVFISTGLLSSSVLFCFGRYICIYITLWGKGDTEIHFSYLVAC